MSDSAVVRARPRAGAGAAVALALLLAALLASPAAAARGRAAGDRLGRLAGVWREARGTAAVDRVALSTAEDDLTAKQAGYDAVSGAVAARGPTRRLDPRDGVVGSSALFGLRSAARDARDAAQLTVAARAADVFDATARATRAADDLVSEVARRGHVDAARLRAAWDATPDRELDVVAFALAQAGKPYVFAAAGPDAYDCSGLTMAAWATQGVHLAHFAATQYAQTQRVRPSDLRPGDLVFFEADLGHVGLYLGARLMVHAPHTGDVVRVASITGRDGMRTGRVGSPR